MEEYGVPPEFPVVTKDTQPVSEPSKHNTVKGRSNKVAKTGSVKYQWDIMKDMDVDASEIPKFADASHWLQYFPPCATDDLKEMGARIDWRRAFTTTDANPYYDSFVRWQFEVMREKGKIVFEKRYAIYSPSECGPCGDDARSVGEGIMPKEYIIVKYQVVSPFVDAIKELEGRKVYIVAAVDAPEMLISQVGCFVHPHGQFGAYEMKNDEIIICPHQMAANMSYQQFTTEEGETSCVKELSGIDLIGTAVHTTSVSMYPTVYILPSTSVSSAEDTGAVNISVNEPTAFKALKTDPSSRCKYHIKEEWVQPFDSVDIKAKSGEITTGEFSGCKVKEAQEKITAKLVETGVAAKYWEPEGPVYARTGDLCVCALTDQWYIQYGEAAWKKDTADHMAQMDLPPDVRAIFDAALDWLNQKPCSRSYGLGTRIPWDPQYLIDSLSDSTIYMAFYTVAHMLQGPDNIFGSVPGPAGIKPEQLTREIWDYIFFDTAMPTNTDIPQETLKALRNEFRYWYPVDMRVSGKDLIGGHLTFFLYNHVAMFPPEMCPRNVRPNGHLLLNTKKMSKSTGNFITLKDAMKLYSVSGMRFALADSGDSTSDDANFKDETAETAVIRLAAMYDFYEETMASISKLKEGEPASLEDFIFQSSLNKAIKETDVHYKDMKYHDALRTGFFELQKAMKVYQASVPVMNRGLVERFLRAQLIMLLPVVPHFCEYVWRKLWTVYSKDEPVSINQARWPEAGPVDEMLLLKKACLDDIIHRASIRVAHLRAKKVDVSEMTLCIADAWPEWKISTYSAVSALYCQETKSFPSDWSKRLAPQFKTVTEKRTLRKMFALAEDIITRVGKEGVAAMEIPSIPFDEREWLDSQSERIVAALPGVSVVHVCVQAQGQQQAGAEPTKPAIRFVGEK